MLNPSYSDLMKKLGSDGSEPAYSRYSIVLAAAKRARCIVEGAEPYTRKASSNKPVSIAVQEIYEGFVTISQE